MIPNHDQKIILNHRSKEDNKMIITTPMTIMEYGKSLSESIKMGDNVLCETMNA